MAHEREYRTTQHKGVQMTCEECEGRGYMYESDPAYTRRCEECNGGWVVARCECGAELKEEPCEVCERCPSCCGCFRCATCDSVPEDEGEQVEFEGKRWCASCFRREFRADYCPDAFGGKGGPCVFRNEDESGCEARCAGGPHV